MIRGTTPTHIFSIPIDSTLISKIRVTYEQNGTNIITKDYSGADVSGGSLYVKLTQDETLLFSSYNTAKVQLRVLTTEGDAMASNVIVMQPERLLDDQGVLE